MVTAKPPSWKRTWPAAVYLVEQPCRVHDTLDADPGDLVRVFDGEHCLALLDAWSPEAQVRDHGHVLVQRLDGDEPPHDGRTVLVVQPVVPITLSSRA